MFRHLLHIFQFFLYNSIDISQCELFGRLISRLRAIPALFAGALISRSINNRLFSVVEEAEQPIKICDERNVVQYVNRAYEIVTGRSRLEVLGTDASEMRLKVSSGLNNGATSSNAPATSDISHLHPPGTVSPSTLPPLVHTAASPSSCGTVAGVITQQPSPISTTPTNNIQSTTPTAHFAEVENLAPGGESLGSSSGQSTFNQLANRRRSSEWHVITVPNAFHG